jgi:hypothetical protein
MVRSPGFEPGSSTWQADVLNQARLRPLVHAFGGVYQPWRLLFKFSEKANAVLVHDVLETLLDELLCFLTCPRFLADVSIAAFVVLAELRVQQHIPERFMVKQYHDGPEVVQTTILHCGFPVPESVEVNFAQSLIAELSYGACTHFPEGFAGVVFGFVVEDEL